jgi:hypothetical protein
VDTGTRRFGSGRHLVGRFLGSLWPGGPRPADDRWARQWCLPGELELWSRMAGPDRRHAVVVARRVGAAGYAERPVMAAALLHDVGKIESGLGTFGRVAATLAAMVAGQRTVASWSDRRGWAGRAGRYLRHDDAGARLLAGAGSDRLTVQWAREHHLDPVRWTVPQPVGRALKLADDD